MTLTMEITSKLIRFGCNVGSPGIDTSSNDTKEILSRYFGTQFHGLGLERQRSETTVTMASPTWLKMFLIF